MGAYTERISAKVAREGRPEVHGATGAAQERKKVVEPAAVVRGAEDDDYVHILRAYAERFIVLVHSLHHCLRILHVTVHRMALRTFHILTLINICSF